MLPTHCLLSAHRNPLSLARDFAPLAVFSSTHILLVLLPGYSRYPCQAAARLRKLSVGDNSASGGLSNASDGAGSNADSVEFAFGAARSRAASARRVAPFSFARATPAKRSRSGRDEGADALALAHDGDNEAGSDARETFQFSIGARPRRQVRKCRRRLASRAAAGSARSASGSAERVVPPAVAPLAVAGTAFFGGAGGAGGVGGLSSGASAPRAPITNGFDMSKFKKPGEWKCEACLVMNPPGGNKCLSCETTKAGDGGSATGQSGVSAAPGGLLLGGTSSSHTFTFGHQPSDGAQGVASTTNFTFGVKPSGSEGGGGSLAGAGDGSTSASRFKFGVGPTAGGSGGFGDGAAARTSTGVSAVPAPAMNGFDMSKFTKPGEWKCASCLVKNPPGSPKCLSCETPKPGGSGVATGSAVGSTSGGAQGSSGTSAAASGLLGGDGSSATRSFTSVQHLPVVGAAGSGAASAPSSAAPFTFGAQRPSAGAVSAEGAAAAATSTAPFKFGVQPNASEPADTGSFKFGVQPSVPGPASTSPFTFGVQRGASGDGKGASSGEKTVTAGSSSHVAPAPVTAGFDMSKFTTPGEWKCESCLVKSGPSLTKCLSCETPKPGGATPSTTGGGDRQAAQSAAPLVPGSRFGLGGTGASATGGASSAASGGFRFGASPASAAAPAGGDTFHFGVPPSVAAQPSTSLFGRPSPNVSVTPTTSAFGVPPPSIAAPPSSSVFGGSSPSVAAPYTSVFGDAPSSAASAPSSLFGSARNAAAGGAEGRGFMFDAPALATAVGLASSAPGVSGGAFGAGASSASSAMGALSNLGDGGGFGFGSLPPPAVPGASSFGGSAPPAGSQLDPQLAVSRFGATNPPSSTPAPAGISSAENPATTGNASVFSIGAGSLPALGGSNPSAVPGLSFGAGSVPAPVSLTFGQAPSFVSNGADAGASAAGSAPAPVSGFTFGGGAGGGGGSGGPSSSSAAGGSFYPTPTFGQNPPTPN